jgi:hypothetical protein
MARASRRRALVRGQDHWHRFEVDRLDHRVRRGRQEPVDEVRAGDRLRLRTTVALEFGPDARERKLRVDAILAQHFRLAMIKMS